MIVIKRNNEEEAVYFDKITQRIKKLCDINPPLDNRWVDPVKVAQKVINGLYNRITTSQLDGLAAETAAHMCTVHPDYSNLAARILISNLQKQTLSSFSQTIKLQYFYVPNKQKKCTRMIADDVYKIIMDNAELLDKTIDHDRDFSFDYFGFKTLEKSYLKKINKVVVERPQYLWMRVAIGIHKNDIESAIETYNLLSKKFIMHATPTLFNASSPRSQLSSCFLLDIKEDSIEGIYDTLKNCAIISKNAGGIGLAIHKIRSNGSYICGTNGESSGIVPMLRVFNDTARYVDQGGGKRKGAMAVYIEPWHSDILEFLDLRKNNGKEENRTRDIFLAVWCSDLFMKRVEDSLKWSLFCPDEAPGLDDVWGEEFDALYCKYEKTPGLARSVIDARELWFKILESKIETGTPYIFFKDTINRLSNQSNLGPIKCSNLCCEIFEYTSTEEIAVCNLASISLPNLVVDGKFSFEELYKIASSLTINLNKIIDINYYPLPETSNSNLRHRPMGIGIQGLADLFIKLKLPFDGPEARILNADIMETIYFAALSTSNKLAIKDGPYSSFKGSPTSMGKFQHDLCGVKPSPRLNLDWEGLREKVVEHGLRNSLLVALMPTASTSQIIGNNECFEPYTSNIYSRNVSAGTYIVINKDLIKDLIKLNLWSTDMKNKIIENDGSIANIDGIPDDIKILYRTVWEIKQKALVDMAMDRAPFIDQGQSFNVFLANPTYSSLSSLHFYSWKIGLKTGSYYLRTRPSIDPIKYSINVGKDAIEQGPVCNLADGSCCHG